MFYRKVVAKITSSFLLMLSGVCMMQAATQAPVSPVSEEIRRLELQVKLSGNELEKQKIALAQLQQKLDEKEIGVTKIADGVYAVSKQAAPGFWQAVGDALAGVAVITVFTGGLILAVLNDVNYHHHLVDRYWSWGDWYWYSGYPIYYI
jgi:hypothetical protein